MPTTCTTTKGTKTTITMSTECKRAILLPPN
jgi:hypothetical protein